MTRPKPTGKRPRVAIEPRDAHQRDGHAVPAANREHAVGWADRQAVDGPDEPLGCLARHDQDIER